MRLMPALLLTAALALPTVAGCNKSDPAPAAATATDQAALDAKDGKRRKRRKVDGDNVDDEKKKAKEVAKRLVGNPAPDFKLKDLDGNEVTLSSFQGKTVVLEWFNPGCPFVVKSHTLGSLVDTAQRHTQDGVVWLAINSGAEGKQGHDPKENAEAKAAWKMAHPILRDPTGEVGKLYGATNTPHMYVVTPEGVVVYAGAIDNSPDGEGKSPRDGALVNHVDTTLAALKNGALVDPAWTKAYGCSVKYGS
jgi:peroxiredoxin